MIPVDWNALIRQIDRSLPGLSLWMHCAPVFDDDSPTEESVGLAIQRQSGPKGRWYVVVFFRVVPDPAAVDEVGLFPPGRGQETSDWTVNVGYQGDHDNLEEAVAEAKDLARHLPSSALYPNEERLAAFLGKVTDPEDLEETA
ncbi:MAG: hypothetical protein H0U02_04185 [Rubrobacter sp.]|jgi:hypothetical protein|nr:hypothetical protein [Rubrobacter sp.]